MTSTYIAPSLTVRHDDDGSVDAVWFGAIAAALGVSVAFVAFVCNACMVTSSFSQCLEAVQNFLFGSGC